MKKVYGVAAGLAIMFGGIHADEVSDMKRTSRYPVLDLIISRWSSRAMSGEAIERTQLMTLFEAARWAPSSYNNQPWRFIFAERDTFAWNSMFDLLVEFNQSWCKNAAVLILVISKDTFDFNGEFSRTHSFDTGAACENLALQAISMGLVVHAMEGFDYDRAKTEFAIPDGYTVEAMFAIGKPGSVRALPEDLQEKETQSDRKSLDEIVFNGTFQPDVE